MNTYKKIMGLALALGLLAVPGYAAMEAGAPALPEKTLADFKREYSGTKPVVAFNKYREYKLLQKVPRPTLEVSRIRESVTPRDPSSGTKPVVRHRAG